MDVACKQLWFESQEMDLKSNNEDKYDSMQVQGKVNKKEKKGWSFKVKMLLNSFISYQIWHVTIDINARAHQLLKQVSFLNVFKIQKQSTLEESL